MTSFELLNPKFMADLYDLNLGISIEVVDNVIYLYANILLMPMTMSTDRYAAMLDILQAAYKELRM